MSYAKGELFAANPATTRLVSTKLSTDPKGEKVVYTNGRTVIIRDLLDPSKSVSYSQHTQQATVARISPSGYYCASGDIAGNVRIWDIAGTDQILKLESKPISGRINDLSWDGESKRIIAVGDGRERFGAAFLADSGSSCGEISGTSKVINSVSIRYQRSFRAVTASDDSTIAFFTGVPFKYDKIIRTHERFVQDVRYSPSGDHFASVGSDGKLFLYDGKDGSTLGEMVASKGTVMACSWSPDSKRLATAAADGTVKLWDIETKQSTLTYNIGNDLNSQQNGVVWASENSVVSLSLDGALNVLDPRTGGEWKSIYGPTKSITAATLSSLPEPTFYAGSFDGSIVAFDIPSGACKPVTGTSHTGQVTGLAAGDEGGKVWSSAWGGGMSVGAIEGKEFVQSASKAVNSPSSIAFASGKVFIGSPESVSIQEGGKEVAQVSVPEGCTAVAASGSNFAYGGKDKKIYLASISGSTVKAEATFDDNRGELLSLAFSPDGKLLAGGDSSGRIVLIDVAEKKTLVSSRWTSHNGRINALSFSPDSLRLASAGLDESVYIWSITKTLKQVAIKNAHAGGVSGVAWQDDKTVLSAGADACVRTWKVEGI